MKEKAKRLKREAALAGGSGYSFVNVLLCYCSSKNGCTPIVMLPPAVTLWVLPCRSL